MSVPADFDAREHARTTFDRPVVVEAGAGTGKTAVLVARTVTWLTDVGWSRHEKDGRDAEEVAARVLERVLALTFTEKAAGEMAVRVGKALEQIAAGSSVLGVPDHAFGDVASATLAERAKACLVHLDRLNVTTVHAWCRRLLAAHPVEAGLHPGFDVDAEGMRRRAVVDEVVAEWVADGFGANPDEDAMALATSDRGPDAVWESLSVLAEEGVDPEDIDVDPFSVGRFARAREELQRDVRPLVEATRPFLTCGGSVRLAQLTASWLARLADVLDQADGFASVVEVFDSPALKDVRNRLGKWGKDDFTGTEAQNLYGDRAVASAAAASLARRVPVWSAFEPDLMPRAARVLKELLTRVRQRLVARGIVSFGDLLARADRVLQNEGVCTRVRAGLDQILVDEFQDTDRRQYDIVGRLALTGDTRPSLFLVGDPKQSIYGWRQADLAAYDQFLDRLRESDGNEPLVLSVNFRSVPPILDEVERVIATTMQREPGLQPAFQPLLPSPERGASDVFEEDSRRPVECWVSWSRDPKDGFTKTSAERARDIEAPAIARDIRELHDRCDVPWRRFSILVRAKTALEKYLRALRDARVPFLVEGDREFYRRREVIDAVNLVRVVLDPNDHLALVGLIRSPMVGVPDAALIPLWEHQFPKHMSELGRGPDALACLRETIALAAADIPGDAESVDQVEGWEAALTEGVLAVASLRRSFAEDAADLFVERLRGVLVSEPVEGARYLGVHRAANLDQIFRRVLEAFTGGEGGPEAVLRELKERVEDIHPEKDATVGEDEVDAVRVMTIHMAKGLDFDHVYLPDLHRDDNEQERDDTRVVTTDHGNEARLMRMPTPGWGAVRTRERDVRRAELVRLLYVALTRARERLVLVGRWDDPARVRRVDRSLLDLIGRRPGNWTDLLSGWLADPEAPDSAHDEHGVAWRLLKEDPEPPAADAFEDPKPPDVEGTANRSTRWLLAQPLAVAHAAREAIVPASSTSHEALVAITRDGDEDDPDALPAGAVPSPADASAFAREIGTAVHRVIEGLDLDSDPVWACAQAGSGLETELADLVSPSALARATRAARPLVDALATSSLIEYLFAIRDRVIGREVPLLLDAAAADRDDATGAIVGAIDLLYEDPDSGDLVVADYKTDRVPEGEDLRTHARTYRAQGSAYVTAVQRAFDLERPPRFELWFLQHDERVVV